MKDRFGLWAGVVLIGIFAWAYLPTFNNLFYQWGRVADYSHGYLVVPIAIAILWLRRDQLPERISSSWWIGLSLLMVAAVMRWVAAKYYLEPMVGWTIPVWIAGCVSILFGWRVLVWSLPAILFLFFMVPLPYSVEIALARPLQSISAQISCFTLQCFMLPAALEGNTILLGEHTLEVARACSGLRITMGVAALAFACAFIFQDSFWNRIMLGLAVLPIAILSNSIRIVLTSFAYQLGFGESAVNFLHDFAGLVMLPIAMLMFLGLSWYLDRLLPQTEQFTSSDILRRKLSKVPSEQSSATN